MGSYKFEKKKSTLGAVISDAYSDLQTLRDEMQETVDNMEGANMEHLPKYDTASEAVSELDVCDNEPDVPEALADLEVEYSEQVNKRKGRGPSREVRLSNATAMLQAVRDLLNERENDDAADELVQEIDEAADLDVTFPGMYG